MKRIAILLCLSVTIAIATAETVYLNDGRQIDGSVRREGDKVFITKDDGEVVEVEKADVLYIAGTTQHVEKAETPEAGPEGGPTGQPGAASDDVTAVALSEAALPETYIWTYLRRGKPGLAERYRALAHDRQRKIGSTWLSPEDFVRRRQAVAKRLAEAAATFAEADDLDLDDDDVDERQRNRNKHQKLMRVGSDQLRRAAAGWPDPLIRKFLLGAAELQADRLGEAIGQFRACVREAPRMAMFHQGLGMAMVRDEQYAEGLEHLATMVRLRPDAEEGVAILREAIEATPGEYMTRPACAAAKELADSLPAARRSRRSRRNDDREISWVLPGDVEDVDAHALPVPDVDRYVFRQAIAVPVGPSVLLVDRQAVYGALTVHVDMGEGKLVQAELPRRWRRAREETDLPVMLLEVPGAVFTPLVDTEALDDDAPPPPPADATDVQVHALNLLAEMGSVPRVFATKVQAGEAAATLLAGLAPGEATAPVLDADGKWLGVQAGKTDADPDKLIDRFISVGELIEVLEDVRSRRRSSRGDDREPIRSDAKVFLVHATHGERFQADP